MQEEALSEREEIFTKLKKNLHGTKRSLYSPEGNPYRAERCLQGA
jgi:hypothetical protein